MTSTITKFSLNVLTYICKTNPAEVAEKKAQEFVNCVNCDLETFLK